MQKHLLIVALICAASPAQAQSLMQEREGFVTVVQAARALIEADVQAADANGAIRRWDRRWQRRLERVQRRRQRLRRCEPRSCAVVEVCKLAASSAAMFVLGVRSRVLAAPDEWSLGSVAKTLASNRMMADEAARRRRAGLSCEDIQDPLSEYRDSAESTGIAGDHLLDEVRVGDVEAYLSIAEGGLAGLEALTLLRRTQQAEAHSVRARAAREQCTGEGLPATALDLVTEALTRTQMPNYPPLALRAAGFEPSSETGREEMVRSRTAALQSLRNRDPEITRAFLRLVTEQGGDRAPEHLVDLIGEVYVRLSIEQATLLIVCEEHRDQASAELPRNNESAPPPN